MRDWTGIVEAIEMLMAQGMSLGEACNTLAAQGKFERATSQQIKMRWFYELRKREKDGGAVNAIKTQVEKEDENSEMFRAQSTSVSDTRASEASDVSEDDFRDYNDVVSAFSNKGGVKVGDIVEGTVDGIQPYGAFVLLPTGETALLYFSEIPGGMYNEVERFFRIGDPVKAKVVAYDSKGYKLSIAAINKPLKPKYDISEHNFATPIGNVAPQLRSIKSSVFPVPAPEPESELKLTPDPTPTTISTSLPITAPTATTGNKINSSKMQRIFESISEYCATLEQENEKLKREVIELKDKITLFYNDDHNAAVQLAKLKELLKLE